MKEKMILPFLMLLLVGCVPKNTLENRVEDSPDNAAKIADQTTITWGNDTKQSLFLDPVDYVGQDPLGKQQQQLIERLVGKMIKISTGRFQMGGNEYANEKPIHNVNIAAFKLGEFEVTQQQWQTVMGSNPSYFDNCINCPVENVSWNDIQSFLKRLSDQTGQLFRLPSETEWEYACRSGGRAQTYCGGNQVDDLAWHYKNSSSKTHPVGRKQANALGLYDMSGNVWEWVQDCYHDSYQGAPSYGIAWESANCDRRVLRGGSWSTNAISTRSFNRGRSTASGRTNYGFRLAHD
jgi:formylglycine-generating enzyme required for sulfatase activity